MNNKVTLYIATHNITGLKYFGKTSKYFTEEDLQNNYRGSGTYWGYHLNKHGKDVTMKIYGIFNIDDVEKVALKFSVENDIVNSVDENGNKIWANLMNENGLDGVPKNRVVVYDTIMKTYVSVSTEEYKNNAHLIHHGKGKCLCKNKEGHVIMLNKGEYMDGYIPLQKGLKRTQQTKDKMSASAQYRQKPSNSKTIQIFDHNDILQYTITGGFKQFCIDNNMPFTALKLSYQNNSTPIYTNCENHAKVGANNKGWLLYFGWCAKVV